MTKGKYRERLGEFFSKYLDIKAGHEFTEDSVIYCGIRELIVNRIFTEKELQREILKRCDVLLPLETIRKCAQW